MKDINKTEREHYLNYAKLSNSITYDDFTTNLLREVRSVLETSLIDKELNYTTLRDASRTMYMSNGFYTMMINYMSGLYTADHYIYPNYKVDLLNDKIEIDNRTNQSTLREDYMDAARLLDKIGVKAMCQEIIETILVDGMGFFYEVNSPNKSNLRKLPNEYCKVTTNEGGVCRYAVNLGALTPSTVLYFPNEIKKAYDEFMIEGSKKPMWYQVSNRGVAFTTNSNSSVGVPYFSYLMDSLSRYEDSKAKSDKKDDIDSVAIIHQKIPVDKNQKPAMSVDMTNRFHEATKSNLPPYMAITTNPLDIGSISFGDSRNHQNDIMERSTKEVWDNAGISNQLFNNTNNSAEALRKNIIVNQIVLEKFFDAIALYLNTRLMKYNHSLVFLPITHMNQDKAMTAYQTNLGNSGGSRLIALAAQGLTPLESVNLLIFEQEYLKVDDFMKPKQTSYTMSGSTDEIGRPTNEEQGVPESESREDAINRGDDGGE